MEKVVLVKSLYRNKDEYLSKEISISGWIRTLRASNAFGFIEVNDGSFFKNIQVLTPTKKGPLGTRELNKALQAVLNPNLEELPEKVSGGVVYRIGDRIMQIKNNYDITWEREVKEGQTEIGTGVFNGEIGTIIEIDEREKVIKIQFDDEKIAWYEYADLDQIEHSYAITIHKAQRK